VKGTLSRSFAFFKGASLACDIDPTLLGVGYIIGYRTSMIMVSGSLLASLILVPMIVLFGSGSSEALEPATELIRNMQPVDVWDQYVRHIGAGAVATGGIFGLIRALPVILSSLRASARSLTGGTAQAASVRTDRDTPTPVLVAGALGIVAFITALPLFKMNLLGAVLILVLGFLFSVVSSRITGEHACIAHAATITSRTDGRMYRYVRLSQDEVPAGMKPGVYLVNESSGKAEYSRQDGVGGPRFPAPQARLMSVVIDGLLTHRL